MTSKQPYRPGKRRPAKRVRDVALSLRPGVVYTLQEACQVLRISEATARRWIKDGRLRARKIGRDYRLLSSDVEASLAGVGAEEGGIKLFGPGNPLLKTIGIGDSGLTDVSSRHHEYLAEAYERHKLGDRRG